MTLFLGGGGDIEDSIEIDKLFFANLDSQDKILYIPAACDFTTYENCLKWFYSLVSKYIKISKDNITMILDEDKVPDLSEYKAIYIGGGNTYKLLDYVIKNNLDEKFKAYLDHGGLIFGGSAGAIIFGKTIKTVIEEKENYPDNQALDFINGYAIRCHYQESEDNLFITLSQSLNIPIVAIPENSGLILKDKYLEIIGKPIIFISGIKDSEYFLRINNAKL